MKGEGEREGWYSSDLTDLREIGQEDRHMEEVSSLLHPPSVDMLSSPAISPFFRLILKPSLHPSPHRSTL